MILGFKDQFVPMVLDGSKTHTIRAGFRWKAGMRADLYTGGYRPGARRLLFRAAVTKVEAIAIKPVGIGESGFCGPFLRVAVNSRLLDGHAVENLFHADGFIPDRRGSASRHAYEFFRRHLPFTGQLIHWDYERRFEKIEDTWRTCYRVSEWTGRRAK